MGRNDNLRPITIVTLNSRKGKPKPIRLTALLDSGGSGCLISKRYAKHLQVVYSSPFSLVHLISANYVA